MDEKLRQKLFPLEPQYRERVWGGQRLRRSDPPVGEAWIAFGESRVRVGAYAGKTVAELANLYGEQLLGAEAAERAGSSFPLLVKLLDCADWLSVQVHPDDEQAGRLEGPGQPGKTEAWHLLEADEGATILAGVKPGTSTRQLEEAIREGRVLDVARQLRVSAGESYLLPAGTLHSLGPGLLLYEVQQASDITYRVYDWDRPASSGRELHVEESVAVTDPSKGAIPTPHTALEGTASAPAVSCPFFELEVLQVTGSPFKGHTGARAFHLLTVTRGEAEVYCGEEVVRLGRFETALVAGCAGSYGIRGASGKAALLLRATVPNGISHGEGHARADD